MVAYPGKGKHPEWYERDLDGKLIHPQREGWKNQVFDPAQGQKASAPETDCDRLSPAKRGQDFQVDAKDHDE